VRRGKAVAQTRQVHKRFAIRRDNEERWRIVRSVRDVKGLSGEAGHYERL
jgi:hypothetical protein